jgi:type I restriction enzyme S subunit
MAQPKLNQTMLNKIPIPFPSLKEQQSIVQKLDTLSSETKKLEVIYQQKIADLEELKKSVLQKAFAGELLSPEGATYTNDGFSPSITKEAEHTNDSYNPSAKNKKPINSPKGT